MGTRLNFDGMKIRALRIERGWTQEQLAEIAGISARTIQRAEAASCAAFETLKAIAAAFETDFAQLLKPEAHTTSDTKPLIEVTASSSDFEIEPKAERPALAVR